MKAWCIKQPVTNLSELRKSANQMNCNGLIWFWSCLIRKVAVVTWTKRPYTTNEYHVTLNHLVIFSIQSMHKICEPRTINWLCSRHRRILCADLFIQQHHQNYARVSLCVCLCCVPCTDRNIIQSNHIVVFHVQYEHIFINVKTTSFVHTYCNGIEDILWNVLE